MQIPSTLMWINCAAAYIILLLLMYILYVILRKPVGQYLHNRRHRKLVHIVSKKISFDYPYFEYEFDATNKRQPNIEDYIDRYLNKYGFDSIESHYKRIQNWKREIRKKIKELPTQEQQSVAYTLFSQACNDKHAFQFHFTRHRTAYMQENYEKYSYTKSFAEQPTELSYSDLKNRYRKLEKINHQCTLSEYNAKNQRKLVTKAVRDRIAKRDNYTCRICGKYMPDGVGLQIDHIVPIAKGGKSVDSNLQVLCSKCNGKKSDK